MNDPISFAKQFHILVETVVDERGRGVSIAALARATAIAEQSLLNLLSGKSETPRLETARRLCHFFGIDLDYFDQDNERACREYLAQRRNAHSLDLLQDIASEAETLSGKGQKHVLTLLEWLRRARSSL